jgi:hypothetical protein
MTLDHLHAKAGLVASQDKGIRMFKH